MNNNHNTVKEKKNLRRNYSMFQGIEYNQDYDNKNNYKNRAVNNNYRFIINNNYYNKNNKNENHLSRKSPIVHRQRRKEKW